MTNKVYDAIVLGKGPLGLLTSHHLVNKKMNVLQIDAGVGLKKIKDEIVINSNINFRGVEQMPSLNNLASKHPWTGACMGWPRKDINLLGIEDKDLKKSEEYVQKLLNIYDFDFSNNIPTDTEKKYEEIIYAAIVDDVKMQNIQSSLNKSTKYEFFDKMIASKILNSEENITEIACINYVDNKSVIIKAKKVFICLGAYENTRLLLSSNLQINEDYLGKNFSEHLTVLVGKYLSYDFKRTKKKFDYYSNKENKLWPRILPETSKGKDNRFFVYTTEHKKRTSVANIGTFKSFLFVEKQENEETFLELNEEKLKINFNVSQDELLKIEKLLDKSREYFQNEKSVKKYGRNNNIFGELDISNHPSGTTRMSLDKSKGVVNNLSQLWEHPNIFVYGSSTFPRANYIHPTFPALTFAQHSLANL